MKRGLTSLALILALSSAAAQAQEEKKSAPQTIQSGVVLNKKGASQGVMCFGGEFPQGSGEGAAEKRVREQCIQACARRGYFVQHGETLDMAVVPKDPDPDLEPLMPAECR